MPYDISFKANIFKSTRIIIKGFADINRLLYPGSDGLEVSLDVKWALIATGIIPITIQKLSDKRMNA